MAEEVVISIKTDASQSVNAVKGLKNEIRELESLSLQAAEAGDEALARRYANAAGVARDKLGDFKDEIKSTADASARFGAIANVGAGIAAGFQAAQGALALFGAQGKAVEEALLKVQAASALAQGLQGVAGLADSFSIAKKVAVDAFKAIRTAIGSTGIGLLVVAAGTLVAYWDDIKAAVSGVSEEQKKLNEQTEANLKAQQDKLSAIDEQDNILKLQGKSERDILKLKIAQTDEVIAATEQSIEQSKITLQAQIQAEERNKTILQGLLDITTAPLQLLIDGIDLVAEKISGSKLIDFNIAEFATKFVFDPEKVEQEGLASQEAQKKSLDNLKNQRAGYQIQIQQIDQAAADKKKEDDAKNKADEEKKIQDAIELAKQQAAAFKSQTEQEYQESIKLTTDYYDALIKQKQLNNEDTTALEIEKAQTLINVGKDYGQNVLQQELDLALKQKEIADKKREQEIADAEKLRQAKISIAQNGINALASIGNIAIKNEAQREKFQKKIAATQILLDTAIAISQMIRDGSKVGITPIEKAVAITTGISLVLGNMAKATALLSKAGTSTPPTLQGGGSTGLGGATPPTPTVPVFNPQGTIIPQGQEQGQQPIKAYVLEDDISTSQNRITDIKTKALYG